MAKRNTTKKHDQLEVDEQVKPLEASVKEEPWVMLQLNYPVRYRYVSSKTGNEYIWERAGFQRLVHPDDAPDLLIKSRKAGCCGATPQTNFIFKEVK
jgi:hypothetical protein